MTITIKNSIVSKDGDEIGKIDGDVCTLLHAVGPTVKAAASKEHGSKLSFVLADGEQADDEADEIPSGPVGNNGPVGDESSPEVPDTRGPKPERCPLNGDKCPVLKAWKEGK